MKDPQNNNTDLDLFTDESTRSRWAWVHQAVAHAKNRNLDELQNSETPEPGRRPNLSLVGS